MFRMSESQVTAVPSWPLESILQGRLAGLPCRLETAGEIFPLRPVPVEPRDRPAAGLVARLVAEVAVVPGARETKASGSDRVMTVAGAVRTD
jgi:hypothetical protein